VRQSGKTAGKVDVYIIRCVFCCHARNEAFQRIESVDSLFRSARTLTPAGQSRVNSTKTTFFFNYNTVSFKRMYKIDQRSGKP